jgi:hypothetical protein
MSKRQRPQTAEAYAKYLYIAREANGDKVHLMNEVQIVDCRVRAFVDGARWARRHAARRAKRT